MSTVVSALAGALASGNAQGTVVGAQAGKNAIENNTLGPDELPFGDDEKEHERQTGDEPVRVVPLNPGMEPVRDENGHPLTYAPGSGVPIGAVAPLPSGYTSTGSGDVIGPKGGMYANGSS
ncbi:hypothetical protein FNN87_26700, partial [Salmonella enterica subsp. diarizonae]|nr:hypothetical protein [Salmonella enterica subsp. diarizonae]ECF5952065.1 hypothetical protein [Salmonella enterica subsp. diarizonae]